MMEELLIDLAALVLIAAGVWLLFAPAGLIVGGVGLLWLGAGVRVRKQRGKPDADKAYRAIEVEDR